MFCDVCGRDNADTLTFCQDCGRRLRQQRAVAPTPPNGLPKVELSSAFGTSGPQAALRPEPSSTFGTSGPQAALRPEPSSPAVEAAPDSGRGSSSSGPASGGRRARPAAPVFSFAPVEAGHAPQAPKPNASAAAAKQRAEPVVEAPAASPASPVSAAPQAVAAQPSPPRAQPIYEGAAKQVSTRPPTTCPECRTPNPPEYRFCVTCGAPLRRPASDRPAAASPPRAHDASPVAHDAGAVPRPAAPVVASDDKIIPAPVVDIASSGSVPAKVVTCTRCHGQSVGGTRFCKFCGAALEEPGTRARTPAEAAEAASPSGRRPLAPPEPTPARQAPEARPAPRAPVAPTQPMTAPQAAVAHAADIGANGSAPRPAPSHEAARRADLVGRVQIAPMSRPLPPASAAAAQPVADPAAGRAHPAEPAAAPRPPPRPAGVPAAPPAPVVHARESEPAHGVSVSELAGSPVPPEPVPLPAPPRPAPGRWQGGRLVVIVEDGSEGKSFSLAEGQLDIGRTDGDIILEDDPYVSPRHARLRRVEGGWILRDLDSTNHVYVRLRRPQVLKDGDLLLLGLEVLQFQTVSDGDRGLGHAIQHGTFLFGSPATPRRARLSQRTVEGVIRDVYHVFRDETVIGREVGDIVFTADPFLSRRHAAIRRNAVSSEFSLVDLDSSNGTYVAIRGEIGIADGDFLRIGQHLFRVDLG